MPLTGREREGGKMTLIREDLHISSFWRKSWRRFPGPFRHKQQVLWGQLFPALAELLPVS